MSTIGLALTAHKIKNRIDTIIVKWDARKALGTWKSLVEQPTEMLKGLTPTRFNVCDSPRFGCMSHGMNTVETVADRPSECISDQDVGAISFGTPRAVGVFTYERFVGVLAPGLNEFEPDARTNDVLGFGW